MSSQEYLPTGIKIDVFTSIAEKSCSEQAPSGTGFIPLLHIAPFPHLIIEIERFSRQQSYLTSYWDKSIIGAK
jgi:hypothetical protein